MHNLKIVTNAMIMAHFRNTVQNQRAARVPSNTSAKKIPAMNADRTEIGCSWRHPEPFSAHSVYAQ